MVRSSNPGDVDRDTAVRLLSERAVLTRAACRELLDSEGSFDGRRPSIALSFLLQWIRENLPESIKVEPHPADGIDRMVVPDNCRDLLQEIRDGAEVCEALFILFTADTPSQFRGDEKSIHDRLAAYWANHGSAARAPSVIECWSGFPSEKKL